MDPVTPDFIDKVAAWSLDRTLQGLITHYSTVTWDFIFDLATDNALYLIGSLGLFVLMFAGQVSLGHGVIIGISAYTAGIVTVNWGWDFYLAAPAAAIAGMLSGVAFWYLLGLRLTLFYLGIGTFALGEAFITLGLNSEYIGGALGFHGIPLRTEWWHVALLLLFAMYAVWRLEISRFGLAMRAIRDNPTVAGAMGINVGTTKLYAWMIGGALAGTSGWLYAHRVTILSPPEFGIFMAITYILAPLIGGLRTFWGTVVGGIFVYWAPWITTTDEPQWRLAFYGVMILLLMIFMPQGLFPATPTRSKGKRRETDAQEAARAAE